MEQNSVPVIHPGDEFLSSFAIEDTREPIIDTITETHIAEEQIEELKEVVEVDDEDVDELDEQANPELQLYSRILSDNEKRKMEKVHTQGKKDAEKERKRIEKESLKAERAREKADKKMQKMVDELEPLEMKSAEA
jgi:chromatin remodeling complex protein RSC6